MSLRCTLSLLVTLAGCSESTPPEAAGEALADAGAGALDAAPGDAAPAVVLPAYDEAGNLLRAEGWEQWVFLGSAVNLSYTEEPYAADVMSAVYMEPTAFAHFRDTGEFREGTMTVLTAYLGETGSPPARSGFYPGRLVAFEMSVKDRTRHAEGWGYYGFAEGSDTGDAHPAADCFDCHDAHAETDHVFTQFYPMLP